MHRSTGAPPHYITAQYSVAQRTHTPTLEDPSSAQHSMAQHSTGHRYTSAHGGSLRIAQCSAQGVWRWGIALLRWVCGCGVGVLPLPHCPIAVGPARAPRRDGGAAGQGGAQSAPVWLWVHGCGCVTTCAVAVVAPVLLPLCCCLAPVPGSGPCACPVASVLWPVACGSVATAPQIFGRSCSCSCSRGGEPLSNCDCNCDRLHCIVLYRNSARSHA